MKARVINTFLPNTQIPLPNGFKSPQGRKAFASYLSKNFQSKLIDKSENKITIDTYKDMLYKTIGNIKPCFNIKQPKENHIAYINCDMSARMLDENKPDHEIIYKGFNICLPNLDGNITCDNSVIVHETRHLFDFMCNPKLILPRGTKFIEEKNCDKFNNIVEYIKSSEYQAPRLFGIFKIHNFEQKLREKLYGMDNEFIIELLQRCRHSAELEINAYKDMEDYAFNKNPLDFIDIIDFHRKLKNRYEFKHKKKICEKLLKEYIQKERTNHDLALQKRGKNH